MALPEGAIQVQLGVGLSTEVGWVVVLPEVVGPWPNRSDVQTEMFLIGSRAESEGMVLSGVLGQAGNPDPLPCPVVESGRPLKVDADNLGW